MFGYYPKSSNPDEMWQIDSIVDYVTDVTRALIGAHMSKANMKEKY
jgi:hypothetical protein